MNYFALTALINLIAAIGGILLVVVRNRYQQEDNKIFVWFSLAVIVWSFGYFNWQIANEYSSALFWIRVLTIGSTLIPILYLHWILDLVIKKSRVKKEILQFGYAITLFFLLFSFTPLFIKEVKPIYQFAFWPQPGFLYHFYLIFSYSGLVGYGLIKLIREYKDLMSELDYLKNPVQITKIGLIIIGSIIGFGGGAANFFLFYNIPIAPYTNILASVGLLMMAWAIRQYSYMYFPKEDLWETLGKIHRLPMDWKEDEENTAEIQNNF